MKKIILISILLTATCAYGWEAFMDRCIKSWIGYPLDAMIKQWGYPDEEKNVAGKKLFIWIDYDYNNNRNSSGISISSTDKKGNKTVFSVGGENIADFCKKTIETDENNIIINGSWKGNSCPLLYGSKLMNPQNKR